MPFLRHFSVRRFVVNFFFSIVRNTVVLVYIRRIIGIRKWKNKLKNI